jgi:cellulose synthase/poly-beta-1,6-N-acetylglucosamine synthase-like glycosyltransferase
MDDVQFTLTMITYIFFILFFFSHVFYFTIGLFTKKKIFPISAPKMTFDFLIVARNEEKVIGQLIDSIHQQSYPASLIRIFVLADNCSDQTFQIASGKPNVIVFEDKVPHHKGKGQAIKTILEKRKVYSQTLSDAVIFFDADNILEKDYTSQMHNAMMQGHSIAIGYRNAKNFGYNLFSVGTSIVFLREAHFLHPSRNALGNSTHINGTGFAVLSSILEETPWTSFSLIEDVEFTIQQLIKGRKVTYVPSAMFYDEQPTTFKVSYHQRVRWIKGAIQNFFLHSAKMLRSLRKQWSFSLFDVWFWIIPFPSILTLLSLVQLLIAQIPLLMEGPLTLTSFQPTYSFLINFMTFAFVIGVATILAAWKTLKANTLQKIVGMVSFPFFSLTFIPVLLFSILTMHSLKWYKTPHHVVIQEKEA